jgi:hypothetical protein
LRAMAVAQAKRRAMPAELAEVVAGVAGDERYRHDMATWVKATKWLEAILVEK